MAPPPSPVFSLCFPSAGISPSPEKNPKTLFLCLFFVKSLFKSNHLPSLPWAGNNPRQRGEHAWRQNSPHVLAHQDAAVHHAARSWVAPKTKIKRHFCSFEWSFFLSVPQHSRKTPGTIRGRESNDSSNNENSKRSIHRSTEG